MTISSTIVRQFLSLLRRCVPTGESTLATPLIRLTATHSKLTLLGVNADVSLSQTIDGFLSANCDFAMVGRSAGGLPPDKWRGHRFRAKTSRGNRTVEHWELHPKAFFFRLSIDHLCPSGRRVQGRNSWVKSLCEPCVMLLDWSDGVPIIAMPFIACCLDAPLGRIVATDGIALFVQGGLALEGAIRGSACVICMDLTSLVIA